VADNLDSDNVDKKIKQNNLNGDLNDSAVDLSEGVAFDMFGVLPSSEYEVRFSHHCSIITGSLVLTKINQIPCNLFF